MKIGQHAKKKGRKDVIRPRDFSGNNLQLSNNYDFKKTVSKLKLLNEIVISLKT